MTELHEVDLCNVACITCGEMFDRRFQRTDTFRYCPGCGNPIHREPKKRRPGPLFPIVGDNAGFNCRCVVKTKGG